MLFVLPFSEAMDTKKKKPRKISILQCLHLCAGLGFSFNLQVLSSSGGGGTKQKKNLKIYCEKRQNIQYFVYC